MASACTSVPTQELSQYRQAFAATQTASEAVLMDFADALHAAAARERAAVPMAEPAGGITATLENGGSKSPDAVEVRRRAVRTIDQFKESFRPVREKRCSLIWTPRHVRRAEQLFMSSRKLRKQLRARRSHAMAG